MSSRATITTNDSFPCEPCDEELVHRNREALLLVHGLVLFIAVIVVVVVDFPSYSILVERCDSSSSSREGL